MSIFSPLLSLVVDLARDLPPPPPAYHDSRNFTLSPETTDCDSADLESELSVPSAGEGSYHSSGPRHTSMPILEVSSETLRKLLRNTSGRRCSLSLFS